MKPEWNRRYHTITYYVCAVACIIVLLFFFLTNMNYVTGVISKVRKVLDPIIVGCIIAYLINPLVKRLENTCFSGLKNGKRPRARLARNLAITLAFLIVFIVLALFLWGVGPQIIRAYQELTGNIETYLSELNTWVRDLVGSSGYLSEQYDKILTNFEESFSELVTTLVNFLMGSYSAVFGVFAEFLEQTLNILLGFVISIYLLASKETVFSQIRKLAVCTMRPRLYKRIRHVLHMTDEMFGGFIIGQIIDSLIIGVITMICCGLLKIPYAPLIALIIGVTNVIPVFGPFLGAIPSALIIFVIDPPKTIIFVIFIILLQQLDGNVICPRILGSQVGISALGVIVSITIMGGLFGVTGMFIGVPTFAVLYALFMEAVDKRLVKKHLPTDLSAYMATENKDAVSTAPSSESAQEDPNESHEPQEERGAE